MNTVIIHQIYRLFEPLCGSSVAPLWLYIGSHECQHTAAKGSVKSKDRGCVAYVLKTGFGTQQGDLIRTILSTQSNVTCLVYVFLSFCSSMFLAHGLHALLLISMFLVLSLSIYSYLLTHVGVAKQQRKLGVYPFSSFLCNSSFILRFYQRSIHLESS